MTAAEAILRRAAVVRRPGTATFHASGRDAQSFLHRMLTQDVKSLAPGRARWSCFLTVRGKVVGDPLVWNLGDRFALTLDAAAAAATIPALERYVIADDVTFADRSADRSHLALAGPSSPDVLRAAGGAPPDEGSFAHATVGGVGCVVLRRDLPPVPAFHVSAPAADASRAFDALVAAGAVPGDDHAWDVLRVETGTPAFGAEIDDRVLPNEVGLDAAISWTKGCYLGQEPVVMAKHRGHPPTRLVRLAVDGAVVPPRGAGVEAGGTPVGRVTTAARAVTKPGVLALAFVRHDLAAPGTALSVAGPVPASATIDSVLVP
jgi:folate-binding protein YgfZ